MRPQLFAVALVALGGLDLIAATGARAEPPSSAQAGEVVRLELGKPIDRTIEGGETHVYVIDVPAGRVVRGVVEQLGVDLLVRVLDPAGALVASVDSPTADQGPEPWTLEGGAPGLWRLEVSRFLPTSKGGHYQARLEESLSADERALELARGRFESPRMLRLWQELRTKGRGAIERFAKELEGHAPLVEPVPGDARGDVFFTFVKRVAPEVRYVGLGGGPNSIGVETGLLRFEGTDLHYVTMRSPKDARFTYAFRQGEPLDVGSDWKRLPTLFSSLERDPWNPLSAMGMSLVELPAAPAQPWITRVPGVPEGRIVQATLHSKILNEERRFAVYLPPSFDPRRGSYPYVIFFDGEAYGLDGEALVPTPTILDNLIAKGKVVPMIGVLLASGSTRERDLTMSAPFARFLAKELAPWLRREYRAASDPARATLAGSSLGGLCAAYAAFHHPEVFGNALSQSGAFWFTPGALEVEAFHRLETGALMREITDAPSKRVRFWLEVGLFEGGGIGLPGTNQLAQNRHLRDVLRAKGYQVTYGEYSGAHDYASWRGSLAAGLMALVK